MAKENLSIPRGTRDFGPQQMMVRNHIFSTIRSVFEGFGFAPLETPAMENLSVLTGKYGDEGDQLIYKILNSGDFLSDVQPDDFGKGYKALTRKVSEKALRYDLTVPLARYVVMNRNTLTYPFKRYQMQPVWRADRPSFGRYREFYQCDADVVGTKSLICEVEIMQMIVEVMKRLEVSDFVIKINHRKILSGLAAFCGAPGREAEMSVSLDKLDKVEWPVVAKELLDRGFSEEFIQKLNSLRTGIVSFTTGEYNALKQELSANELASAGFSDLDQILSLLSGFPEVREKMRFDLSLARGLSYYTGPIFEVVPQGVKVGSISGGGRYDELTSVFGVDGIPGVGFSFGIDRVYDLLTELGKVSSMPASATRVLVVQFDEMQVPYYLSLLSRLRSEGIPCELYPEPAKLKKQFAYADAKQIPWVLVAGEDEIREGNFTLKNLSNGTQEKIGLADVLMKLSQK
jgi:histidyl-tRNA synthetase